MRSSAEDCPSTVLTTSPAQTIQLRGPKRPHEHKDLRFWFQGPKQREYQRSCVAGSLCLCGLLGLHSYPATPSSQVVSIVLTGYCSCESKQCLYILLLGQEPRIQGIGLPGYPPLEYFVSFFGVTLNLVEGSWSVLVNPPSLHLFVILPQGPMPDFNALTSGEFVVYGWVVSHKAPVPVLQGTKWANRSHMGEVWKLHPTFWL